MLSTLLVINKSFVDLNWRFRTWKTQLMIDYCKFEGISLLENDWFDIHLEEKWEDLALFAPAAFDRWTLAVIPYTVSSKLQEGERRKKQWIIESVIKTSVLDELGYIDGPLSWLFQFSNQEYGRHWVAPESTTALGPCLHHPGEDDRRDTSQTNHPVIHNNEIDVSICQWISKRIIQFENDFHLSLVEHGSDTVGDVDQTTSIAGSNKQEAISSFQNEMLQLLIG